MRHIVFICTILISGILLDCSSPMGGSSIGAPPIPSTGSIWPLGIGNSWEYWYTCYDSTGNKLPLTDRTLSRSIPGGFVQLNDTVLTPVDNIIYYDKVDRYVYKFEWENLDSGMFVRHIGDGDLSKRGLYIVGEYSHQTATLYDTAVLWLAYPAAAGKIWTVALPGKQPLTSTTMELISSNAHFYIPATEGERASPLVFRDSCYLYKETIGEYTTYYYYHLDIGCLGYLQYKNDVLNVTYILRTFKKNYY